MLTREQWESLAKFAGVHVHHFDNAAGKLVLVDADTDDDGDYWQPDILWNDFGPLWVKLYQWLQNDFSVVHNNVILFNHALAFESAVLQGTEQELMQAGCLLGAAIGATMTAPTAQESK